MVLDESIAQGIQQEAPERGTPTGRPHADLTLIELSIKRAGGSQP